MLDKYAMNDKCAAGSGMFLETMATVLEVGIGEMGKWSEQSSAPVAISNQCAVFAESEVVGYIHRRVPKADIIRGLHDSLAHGSMGVLARVRPGAEIVFCGGVAKNKGMVQALSDASEKRILVPEQPEFTEALGAALCGAR